MPERGDPAVSTTRHGWLAMPSVLLGAALSAPAAAQQDGMRPSIGTPFAVQSAFPQSRGDLRFDAILGWTRDRGGSHTLAPNPSVKWGVAEGLELRLGGQRAFGAGSAAGTGSISTGFRWRLADEEGWRPALALQAEVVAPFGRGDSTTRTEVLAIASRTTGRGPGSWGVHLNAGWSARPSPRGDERHHGYLLGAAISHVLGPDTLLAAAYQHESQARGQLDLSVVEAGFEHRIRDGLAVALAAGAGLNHDSPAFRIRFGLRFSFGVGP
jgi:hypothetical protein